MKKFTKHLGIFCFEYYGKCNFRFNIVNYFNFIISKINDRFYGCICHKVKGVSIMFKFKKYIPDFGFAFHTFMNKIFTSGDATLDKRKRFVLHLIYISIYFEYIIR